MSYIRNTVKIHGASCLVELGAGFGAKIFKLSQKKEFKNIPLKAGEYTNAGIKLIKLIGYNTNVDIEVGYCDFQEMILKDFKILKMPLFLHRTLHATYLNCQINFQLP